MRQPVPMGLMDVFKLDCSLFPDYNSDETLSPPEYCSLWPVITRHEHLPRKLCWLAAVPMRPQTPSGDPKCWCNNGTAAGSKQNAQAGTSQYAQLKDMKRTLPQPRLNPFTFKFPSMLRPDVSFEAQYKYTYSSTGGIKCRCIAASPTGGAADTAHTCHETARSKITLTRMIEAQSRSLAPGAFVGKLRCRPK